MQRSLWLSAALLVGGAAACGGGSKVDGDAPFDVKSSRALSVDAGSGLMFSQVFLMNTDVSCDQLKTYLQKTENPDPNATTPVFPPFSQAVVLEFPSTAGSHGILRPITIFPDGGNSAGAGPKGDSELLEVDVLQAFQAISGTVTVSALGKSAQGSFDTKALDVQSYFDFTLNGGKTDGSGNPLRGDGGVIPQKSITGDFQADLCP